MSSLRMVPVNIEEDLWVQAVRVAAASGTTVSEIVRTELERLVEQGEAS